MALRTVPSFRLSSFLPLPYPPRLKSNKYGCTFPILKQMSVLLYTAVNLLAEKSSACGLLGCLVIVILSQSGEGACSRGKPQKQAFLLYPPPTPNPPPLPNLCSAWYPRAGRPWGCLVETTDVHGQCYRRLASGGVLAEGSSFPGT